MFARTSLAFVRTRAPLSVARAYGRHTMALSSSAFDEEMSKLYNQMVRCSEHHHHLHRSIHFSALISPTILYNIVTPHTLCARDQLARAATGLRRVPPKSLSCHPSESEAAPDSS